jgi:hypothetical protein
MTKVESLLHKVASKNGVVLTKSLRTQVMLRLSHADVENIEDESQASSLVETVLKRLLPKTATTKGILKTANAGGCPRCSRGVSQIHLADGSQSNYCESCRIVC